MKKKNDAVAQCPYFFTLVQFRYPVWGQEPGSLTHRHCRNEYLAQLIISQLEQVVMQWNAILFQLFNGWTIYSPVCLFLYIKVRWNYDPQVEFVKEASQFENTLWENHDLTVQPVITYVYLCGRIPTSCLSYFCNCHSVMDQKPNWNVRLALEKIYHWYFIIYRRCLVPSSINISCDRLSLSLSVFWLP